MIHTLALRSTLFPHFRFGRMCCVPVEKMLDTPADGLMETGRPGSVDPHPPGMKKMFKKIALCAMLVLILAPAAVMAAGQQGQAPGIGKEAGIA